MVARSPTAARLVGLVALAGVLPILVVGAFAIEVMRRHAADASLAALHSAAELAAARVEGYLLAQEEALRVAAAAAGPDAPARLADVALQAPALQRLALLEPGHAPAIPLRIDARALDAVRAGTPVRSAPYVGADGRPALDLCMPGATLGAGVCATLDLAALWPLLARLEGGRTGNVLAFDASGRLLSPEPGPLRPDSLAAPGSAWAPAARYAAGAGEPPGRWQSASDVDVLGGWARIASLGWTLVVAEPAADALRSARLAQWVLAAVASVALVLSIAMGVSQSQRVLGDLAAEERWRVAGRIAAGVSHDLGHRVAILQHVARLADEAEPAQLPRIRDTLRAEVATLRKFVADFSDLSRDVAPEALPLDVDAFAESVVRTAAAEAEAAGVRLLRVASGAEAWARTDRHLLERATLNLVWNAFEASRRGGEVRVRVTAADARVVLAVEDDGAGIAPELLPRIFDGFASSKRSGGHVGMGLANVKRIAAALGAAVTVDSAPGRGTVFRIALDRIPAPDDPG